jgi:prevent-host-death family protein
MPEIGVRELKAKASEIVRAIRKKQGRYTITYRGRPVGQLIPLSEPESLNSALETETSATTWEELTRLGKEIDRRRRKDQSSSEVLSAMRR